MIDKPLYFTFVKTADTRTLEDAVKIINRTRNHTVSYERIFLTGMRQNWVALIMDSTGVDHYLLRNVSGRMNTTAFELASSGLSFSYRIHKNGQTESAFESHPEIWITRQLRLIVNTRDIKRLDLAEPGERFVLQQFHEHQRFHPWTQPVIRRGVPDRLREYYEGDVNYLRPFVKPGTGTAYLEATLKPGIAAGAAVERLLQVLNFPYLPGDRVEVEDSGPMVFTEDGVESASRQQIEGYAILDIDTWKDRKTLPAGWRVLTPDNWTD